MKEREIRAVFNEETITVYQAYRKEIALSAIKAQTFVPPFKIERMTWIKPSFLWMMYRSGWAQKEGQEHILAIKLKREGFEWALKRACLSTFNDSVYRDYTIWQEQLSQTPVRVQWDPEKNIRLENLDFKSIQIGLKNEAVKKYVEDWIIQIDDITDYAKTIHQFILNNQIEKASEMLPIEKVYPLPDSIKRIINAD